MPQRVTVLILGGRLTPNLVGILTLQPAAVEFVVSKDTPFRYKEICAVLEQFADLDTAEPQYLSAYDLLGNRDACLKAAQAHPEAEIIFDVTSAPKIMGFAAYEAARSLNQRAVIVDTANGRVIDLIPPTATTVPIEISLEQYLACYGRRPVSTFDFNKLSIDRQTAIEVARYLGNTGMAAAEVLNKMRSWNLGKGKRTIPFKKTRPLSPEEQDVLRKLQSFGLINNLQEQADGRVRYTILNEMNWKYIEGTWLEVFVWDQASHCINDKGQPLFRNDDLGFSLAVPSDGALREIDVSCVYYGQMIHASCKTGKNSFEKKNLDELRAVSSLIGGRFASRLFVTNVFPPSETDSGYQDFQKFLGQAKDNDIVVVTGKDLPEIGNILKQQVLRPEYPRI